MKQILLFPALFYFCASTTLLIGCKTTEIEAESTHTTDVVKPNPSAQADSVTETESNTLLNRETFSTPLPSLPYWVSDSYPADGPFSDAGIYFSSLGIVPPTAYRTELRFGNDDWLTVELYSREPTPVTDMLAIVKDPENPDNSVLRLSSPHHTDGVIVRTTEPLPQEYRISLKVGFANFGNGSYPNGYSHGNEEATPWVPASNTPIGSAVGENGFYWLAIIDQSPRPHNNIWIHHHRKFVIDSDNNFPAWTSIFNGEQFQLSGEHPISIFALDGTATPHMHNGPPFIMYANNEWQPSGKIRAVDAYLSHQWYQVIFTRTTSHYHFSVSGRFKYGGEHTYEGSIDFKERCLYHYNQTAEDLTNDCINERFFDLLGAQYPHWPYGSKYPDYLMIGDPHNNYYEGSILYDDIILEKL